MDLIKEDYQIRIQKFNSDLNAVSLDYWTAFCPIYTVYDPCPFYIPHNITYPIVRQQHKDFVNGCVKNPNMNVNVVEARDTFKKEL